MTYSLGPSARRRWPREEGDLPGYLKMLSELDSSTSMHGWSLLAIDVPKLTYVSTTVHFDALTTKLLKLVNKERLQNVIMIWLSGGTMLFTQQ